MLTGDPQHDELDRDLRAYTTVARVAAAEPPEPSGCSRRAPNRRAHGLYVADNCLQTCLGAVQQACDTMHLLLAT